jgi:sensor histidine kinase YesM
MWLIAWWLVWLLITTGQSLIFYFAYGDYSDFLIYEGLFSLFIFSVIAFSIWYPFNFFNSGTIKLTTLISNLTVSGIISIGLWIILTRLFVTLILTNNSDYLLFRNNTLPYRIGLGIFIYGLVILTYYLYVNMVNLSEKKSQEARLENLVTETELKMLQSQINPHFLFNSLNSISSLTMTDPEKARIMIVKLSEFMRYALSEKEDQQVSFKSELENLRLYLDIEKVRFGEKLTCEESVENNCLDVKMPVMLLQPLYENAVKHGVYESTQSVRIKTVEVPPTTS